MMSLRQRYQRCTQFEKGWLWSVGLLFVLLAAYLLICHYAKLYSDPVGYVRRAMMWGEGRTGTSRAPLYPIILYFIMELTGRDWVYISNLPFVLIFTAVVGWVTYVVCKREEGMASYALLASFAAMTVLVLIQARLLLELVNPFREPLAFSMLLGATGLLITGWQRPQRPGWMLAAGLCLGLATSIRETCILMTLPFGLWILSEMVAKRRVVIVPLLVFGVGAVIGLGPLLHRNYQHSGSAVVPSYVAGQVEGLTERPKWDIPVPGMSLSHFERVGPETVQRMMSKYGWIHLALFVSGIAFAVWYRHRTILFLFTPATLMVIFFYSFYRYYKERYLLGADIFTVPVVAYGLVCVVRWTEERLRVWRSGFNVSWVQVGVLGLLMLLAGYELVNRVGKRSTVTKVWHLAPVREQIMAHIEEPAVFLGHRHFSFRMRWLLDQRLYEYERTFFRDRTPYPSLDARLGAFGAETIQRFSEGNYYIDRRGFTVGDNWLLLTEVFNFDDLTVPFERYGRLESGPVSRVTLWTNMSYRISKVRDPSQSALLMLDLKRIWDYPERSYAVLKESPEGTAHALTNAVQFVELPANPDYELGKPVITSDQPLPNELFWKYHKLNEPITISFGTRAAHWAWNLASSSLYPGPGLPGDSCLLYDEGQIVVPMFADPDHMVYARIRVEFVQEHPIWLTNTHWVTVSSPVASSTRRLPPRRFQDQIIIPLGYGAGRLSEVTIDLSTNLPDYETQNTFPFWAFCRSNGLVKIYDVTSFSRKPHQTYPVQVDFGSGREDPDLRSGFYGGERSEGRTGRWSDGHASLALLLPPTDEPLTMVWRALPIRPDHAKVTPALEVNGHRVPAERVSTREEDGVWTYRAELDPAWLTADTWQQFDLITSSWNPAEVLGVPDARTLGIFLADFKIGPRL